MIGIFYFTIVFILVSTWSAVCLSNDQTSHVSPLPSQPAIDKVHGPANVNGPIRVTIIENHDAGYQLYRGGEPYFIKGVGGGRFLESAAAAGANSVRTWGAHNADAVLKHTHGLGMTVMLGIWLSHDPADYEDSSYKKRKTEEVQRLLERHRHHPALLMWALGNEINLGGADTETAWRFVNDLASLIQQQDEDHPVISVIACKESTLEKIAAFAPELDAVGINAYGALMGLRAMVDSSSYQGPYMITEWGVKGHWEAELTSWGRPIEPTSAWKADYQLSRYHQDILTNRDRCVGAYVFLWGQKMERTPTWYSIILEDLPGLNGESFSSPAVDVMHYNWTGKWPTNRSPEVMSMLINGNSAKNNIVLFPGESMTSFVNARDPEDDGLTYVWDLLEEPKDLGVGGAYEPKPISLVTIKQDNLPKLSLNAPLSAGEYRLFVYVLDHQGHAATANIPFRVRLFSDQDDSIRSTHLNPG